MSPFILVLCTIYRIVLGTIKCEPPFSCVGQAINATEFYDFSGYKSGFGPNTSWTSTSNTMCRGAYACSQMAFMQTNGYATCDGVLSCSNTSFTGQTMNLRAPNAAAFTSITSNPDSTSSKVTCRALQSCSHTSIHYMSLIIAYGSYSLYKARIDTQNKHNLTHFTLDLYADYAASAATMICASGTNCTINCYAHTSCFNFYIDCRGNCTINTLSNDAHTIAPVTNITQFDPAMPIPSVLDALSYTVANDMLCSSSPTAITADGHWSSGGNQALVLSDAGPLCCRGHIACQGFDKNIGYQNITGQSLICNGARGCQYAVIDTNHGKAFCSARGACSDATIHNTDIAYCLSWKSCQLTRIYNVRDILCTGELACASANITSNGTDLNVSFSGWKSGESANVYCDVGDVCHVRCEGYDTCTNMTLYCDGMCDLQCDEWSGCPVTYSLNPTAAPTVPTYHPTHFPSVSPTLPTLFPSNIPTLFPSNIPTRHPHENTGTNVTISITFKDCFFADESTNCNISEDKINTILIAYLDDDVEILRTVIVLNKVSVIIAVATADELEKDAIDGIKHDLEVEYGDVDVIIEDNDDHDTEEDEKDPMALIMPYVVPLSAFLCVICATVCVYNYIKKKRLAQVSMLAKEVEAEVEVEVEVNDITVPGGGNKDEIDEKMEQEDHGDGIATQGATDEKLHEDESNSTTANDEELYDVNEELYDVDAAKQTEGAHDTTGGTRDGDTTKGRKHENETTKGATDGNVTKGTKD
eukprot:247180_1